jgi:AraC family transcriptional regulator
METIALDRSHPVHSPMLSGQERDRGNVFVEQHQPPRGECHVYSDREHLICLSLSSRPVRLLQVTAGKTHTSFYRKGDMSITPARIPTFFRWEEDDNYLQIRIASQFIQQVARETLAKNPDNLELIPKFRMRDPQLEAIALLLQTELQQNHLGNKLYVDSLANILAVHLLRQYTAALPTISNYQGGLPQHQLMQVLEYIDAHLEEDIKLVDLATLLDMSQFHFSTLFKQAIGTSPYQYLLQQRIERAKQLLKQTERSIVDIALECGFNSHSHLSKQFRQLTGITPTAYRAN